MDAAEKSNRSAEVTASSAFGSQRVIWMLAALASVVIVGFLAVLSKVSGSVDINHVMADAQSRSGAPPVIALGSDIGMYCWVSSIALGLYALHLATKKGGALKSHARYFYALLGLTFVLLVDDRLMLHDYYLRFGLGINEIYTFMVIGLMAGLFFVLGFRWHHMGGWPIFLTSIGLLSGSVLVDQLDTALFVGSFGSNAEAVHLLMEDGLKLAGIIFWMVFVARVGLTIVSETEKAHAKPAS